MLIIGLTGNYGMGKSTVLSMFRKCGAYAINADDIVKELLEKTYIKNKIKKIFKDDFFYSNGRINKKKIADAIFSDNELKTKLENILHPLVIKKIFSLIKAVKKKYSFVIVEVPLLFEKEYQNIFNKTITVFTTEKEAIKRLEKKGINKTDAIKRLKSQIPIKEKIKKSDYIIDNGGSIESTMKIVENLYQNLSKEVTNGNY